MAVRMEDLPPWAQQQAIHKMQAEARRKAPASSLPAQTPENGSKYHNQRARRELEDGTVLTFDSQKEARRFDQLLLMLRAGEIRELKLQPQFTIQEAYTTLEGQRIRALRYQADFSYERKTAPDCTGAVHWLFTVEDVKSAGTRTRVYEIKKKLLRERRGIEIKEV